MNPTTARPTDGAALHRLRTFVRAVLTLGVAASITANVLHAQDSFVGRAISAWPPLALLLTVELISRVPVHRRWLAVVRVIVTATVAGIAAWVSYWHMVEVCLKYGEGTTSAHLIPLAVDGLIVVASICLVEVNGRIRTAAAALDAAATLPPAPVTVPAAPVTTPAAVGATPAPKPTPAPAASTTSTTSTGTRKGRPKDTAVAVAKVRRQHPDLTPAQIADRVGVSARTVHRYLTPTTTTTDASATSTSDTSTDTATEADDAPASRAA